MSWYKIPLSKEQIVAGLEMRIQNEFNTLFSTVGGPKDMALFSSKLPNRESALFVSPGSFPVAESLVRTYGGVPCDKPNRGDVALLLGYQTELDRLLS